MVIPEEGGGSCLSKLFCLMANVKTHTLLRVNQGLNTFCAKECPGREAHWLNAQGVYLDTSLAWRTEALYAAVTDCCGPQGHGYMFQSRELGREWPHSCHSLLGV